MCTNNGGIIYLFAGNVFFANLAPSKMQIFGFFELYGIALSREKKNTSNLAQMLIIITKHCPLTGSTSPIPHTNRI